MCVCVCVCVRIYICIYTYTYMYIYGREGRVCVRGAAHVEVEPNWRLRILRLEVEQCRDHLVGKVVVDVAREQDDPLAVHARVDRDPRRLFHTRELVGHLQARASDHMMPGMRQQRQTRSGPYAASISRRMSNSAGVSTGDHSGANDDCWCKQALTIGVALGIISGPAAAVRDTRPADAVLPGAKLYPKPAPRASSSAMLEPALPKCASAVERNFAARAIYKGLFMDHSLSRSARCVGHVG